MKRRLAAFVAAVALGVSALAMPASATTGIEQHYIDVGGANFLGSATSGENALNPACVTGGRYVNYQYGAITWVPGWAVSETHGAIRSKWQSTGFECGHWGWPVTDTLYDAVGATQIYESIWGVGAITYKWGDWQAFTIDPWYIYQAWVNTNGRLGYPTSDLIYGGLFAGHPWYGQNFEHGMIFRDEWPTGTSISVQYFG